MKVSKTTMSIGIYAIVCNPTNKVYVGQSINIKVRKGKHVSDLSANKHCNQYLQNSYNKYGRSAFSFRVLENCSKELLNEREAFWIKFYSSNNSEYGFNLREVLDSPCSKEHSEACGVATIKRNVEKHGLWTLFNLQTGKVIEVESKKQYTGDKTYNYKKHYLCLRTWTLKDFKTHYEKYNSYQQLNTKANRIYAKNLTTGEVQEFPSVCRGAKELGINEGLVRNVVLGRKLSTNGYTFSKTTDFPEQADRTCIAVFVLDKDGCRYYDSQYTAASLEFPNDKHASSYIKDFIDTKRTHKGCRFFSTQPTEVDNTIIQYNLTPQEALTYKIIYENKVIQPKQLPSTSKTRNHQIKQKLISCNLISQCPNTFIISLAS
jgi:group I intron endonuclease